MKFLANENFPLSSVIYLRSKGFNIKAIGTDSPGITDKEVMDIAIEENRTILTFDSDYGELIFKFGYKPSAGVIYLRWPEFAPNEPAEYLIKLLEGKTILFKNMLSVIDRNSIRQRKFSS